MCVVLLELEWASRWSEPHTSLFARVLDPHKQDELQVSRMGGQCQIRSVQIHKLRRKNERIRAQIEDTKPRRRTEKELQASARLAPSQEHQSRLEKCAKSAQPWMGYCSFSFLSLVKHIYIICYFIKIKTTRKRLGEITKNMKLFFKNVDMIPDLWCQTVLVQLVLYCSPNWPISKNDIISLHLNLFKWISSV